MNTSKFKGWVHDRIGWPQDQTGAWHIAQDFSDAYCKEIVGEDRIVLPRKTLWLKKGDHHRLDCEALQVFLAFLKGVPLLPPPPDDDDDAGSSLADLAKKLNG